MKPFSFGLQKVLNLRKHYEDEAKIELGRAVGALAELEMKVNVLGEERSRAAAAQFGQGNNAAMIQQYMLYLMRIDSAKEQLLKDAAAAELKVEQAREVFIEKSREKQILDKLKDKRYKEYRRMVSAEETRVLDDISAGAPARLKAV